MKRTAIIVAAAMGLAASPSTFANEALAKASGCLNCHNVEGAKKVGASFKDLSAKHKGKADAQATLVAKIAAGKAHPATTASAEDQKTLVKWILAL